ncbi:MAG: hypothetical protein MUC36_25905 [Planctomycetes bacterium]|nr:hypothetical protein [Planctomycetota bacterium]
MFVRLSRCTLFPLLVALAACSGGGGNAAAVQPSPSVVITADNAREVASSAWRGAFDLIAIGRLCGAFLQIAPPSPPTPAAAPGSAPAIITQTISGPDGGNAIFTWDDRDRDATYTSGDQFTIGFADYAASGLLLTGACVFDDVRIQGNVLTGLGWILQARMDLIGLVVTRGASVTPWNGSFPFGREKRTTVDLLSVAVERGVAIGQRVLAAGSVMARNDYVLDFRMGLSATGRLDDAALGGVLEFASKGVLTGLSALPDPSTGAFEVRGAAGSMLVVVPVDFFNAELQVDADGDGEFETVIPVEWAEL